jgi:predicted dehydrogenase
LGQRRVFDYPVEDGAALLVRFASGAIAVHQVAYNMPETLPRRTLEIQGTGGTAIALNTMGQEAGGTLELIHAADGSRRRVEVTPDEDRSPFLNQVEAFAGAALVGEPFPFPPERDLHTMRVLVEALRGVTESLSSRTGS